MKPNYLTKIDDVKKLNDEERSGLKKVTEKYAFRANEYYLSLINWNDPEDPIRRLIIPDFQELEEWGQLDASDEKSYTLIPGLQHKYDSTAVFLISNVCGGICRYCFRKRIFIEKNTEILKDPENALEYIKEHKEISNVLLTGGDPLILSTPRIENIIKKLMEIEHIKIVRIGTKLLSFNPHRILDDPSILKMIEKYSNKEKKIYVITHFNHSNELTDIAVKAVALLQKSGAVMANQTPIIRGVNDKPEYLAALFNKLSYIGSPPYYVFQCRPAVGNRAYAVPIEEGYDIFEKAKTLGSGLAKRAKFVMSHSTGKIEVVGKTRGSICLKYHRAADNKKSGHFMVFKNNPQAYWFDDYNEVIQNYSLY
ncbi:MAG: KamA family radical SAM protein [Thermodesulfobacteriota bacterium]|nr:KamA family radical SAM protein [Thermodesulfobacteriota bacterium]